jgi:hypothetical protein
MEARLVPVHVNCSCWVCTQAVLFSTESELFGHEQLRSAVLCLIDIDVLA